jgi:intracellular multiplication protein IcmT
MNNVKIIRSIVTMARNEHLSAHWRDSARQARFFMIDAQAAFPFLIFLLHIRWWTFFLALAATFFFSFLAKYGFTVPVFFRWIRTALAGPRKIADPEWRK